MQSISIFAFLCLNTYARVLPRDSTGLQVFNVVRTVVVTEFVTVYASPQASTSNLTSLPVQATSKYLVPGTILAVSTANSQATTTSFSEPFVFLAPPWPSAVQSSFAAIASAEWVSYNLTHTTSTEAVTTTKPAISSFSEPFIFPAPPVHPSDISILVAEASADSERFPNGVLNQALDVHSKTFATAATAVALTPRSTIEEGVMQNQFPFDKLIAFGDNLSDNGNGSYKHKVTGKPGEDNKVYGHGTWTDHQVAVSYLADLINCPLTKDFAFGHAWGGSASGATVDDTLYFSDFRSSKSSSPYFTNIFSSSCNGAPSSKVQIADYLFNGVDKSALHFLWIGNNDVNMQTMIQLSDTFATLYAQKVTQQVQSLRDAGAEYIIVVNIYAKHLAPVLPSYYGWTTLEQKDKFASFISKANTALQSSLAAAFEPRNVLYYDVFSFMQALWNDGGSYGFRNKLDVNGQPACCDDDKALTGQVKAMYAVGEVQGVDGKQSNWGVCVEQGRWDEWFWMQDLDMTSAVHQYIAKDMSERIKEHWSS